LTTASTLTSRQCQEQLLHLILGEGGLLTSQLGVDKWVGSLEVGKDGDIAVFSTHPFAPTAMVEYTLIEGKVYFDRNDAVTLRKTVSTTGGAK
jgi:hypothetical protein